MFWNDSYPFGINGTSCSTIIDFDEAAIFLRSTSRGYGKCFLSTRARESGPYNHSEKYTIPAAIHGGANGGCWLEMDLRTGTAVIDTYDFLPPKHHLTNWTRRSQCYYWNRQHPHLHMQ